MAFLVSTERPASLDGARVIDRDHVGAQVIEDPFVSLGWVRACGSTHGLSGYAPGSYWRHGAIICGACGVRIEGPPPTSFVAGNPAWPSWLGGFPTRTLPGTQTLSYCPGCLQPWPSGGAGRVGVRVCKACDRCEQRLCPCNAALCDPPLVVMEDKPFDDFLKEALGNDAPTLPKWMRRLGFRTNAYTQGPWDAAPNGRVLVRRGHERSQRLLIHEYGHVLGFWHPPTRTLRQKVRFFFDVMGYGLRIYDPHGIRGLSRGWRWRRHRRRPAGRPRST